MIIEMFIRTSFEAAKKMLFEWKSKFAISKSANLGSEKAFIEVFILKSHNLIVLSSDDVAIVVLPASSIL